MVAAYSVGNLFSEPTNCVYLPFAIYKWHEYIENPKKAIRLVFLVGSLPYLRLFEPLLDVELSKRASPKCWNSNPCYFVDLLLERPLIAKPPAVRREELDRCRC